MNKGIHQDKTNVCVQNVAKIHDYRRVGDPNNMSYSSKRNAIKNSDSTG